MPSGYHPHDDLSWQDTDVFEPIRDDPYAPEPPGRKPTPPWMYAMIVALVLGVGGGITVGGLYLSGAIGAVQTEAAGEASTPVSVAPAPLTTTAAPAPAYVGIVEPWSTDGSAAQEQPSGETCSVTDGSTSEITACYQLRTETLDARINSARKAAFTKADAAERQTILSEDTAWLAARATVCRARPTSGGTIDKIYAAQCLHDVSDARLAEVNEESPPVAKFTMGKSLESGLLAWYSTPKGSLVSAYQGGQAQKSATVCFAVIGGYAGFTVDTDQFTYAEGSQTLRGQQLGSDTSVDGYQVGTGELINFCMRYEDAKPHSKQGSATYSPGSPAAVWTVKKAG